ncbi:MAG: DUF560 domain-containing protein [Sphingomonadaceae bacterium]|nr:DUF560 domain-containing protein [Sphingomonadaceae bacterium]
MQKQTYIAAIAASWIAMAGSPAAAQDDTLCENGGCTIAMDGNALLASASRLIEAERYDEARLVLTALENSPELSTQTNLLMGHVAMRAGDIDGAIGHFRTVLNEQPGQIRARLELARALMMAGRHSSADHHFRLAEQDDNLPEDVANLVRSARGLIRDRRGWHLDVEVGFAPDTNINNATDTQRVDLVAGPFVLPLSLGENSRAQSGIGQIVGLSGGIEVGLSGDVALSIDADARFTNYSGGDFDDLSGALAIGPEIRFSDRNRLTVQALANQRFYGWNDAQRSFGLRANYQRVLNRGARLALAVDGRRIDSGFGDQFSGWQMGLYGTYEQVLNRSLIASATVFGRRDALRSDAYSHFEVGGRIGIGGELPLGINAGVSGGVSRALYDGALPLFSVKPRQDWRFNSQVQLGLRSLRVLGFSPTVTYSYGRTDSNVSLFQSDRHRVEFGLARYF